MLKIGLSFAERSKMKNRMVVFFACALTAFIAGARVEVAAEAHRNHFNRERNWNTRPAESAKKSQKQEALAREAKISIEQAREIALKRAPGKIESGELERERGRLVYSFDIRNAKGTITEVQVSAVTGKIVSVKHENKKQEAAEKQKDKRAAKH
jgi:uncharacterized membrane protein YkoI